MATVWKTLPTTAPTNGATVWVRKWFLSAPFLATWSTSGATFTHSSGLAMPWYEIWRWRSQ